MILLKPNNVSGEILNLLDEANEKVIIVSPYCKFDKWYKLVKKLKDLKNRNIEVEFYIRDNEPDSYKQVVDIGITPICIPNLHAKLYLNEKYGIVTSMNLLLSSEINSLELGYKTESKIEFGELLSFYETYLLKGKIKESIAIDWKTSLYNKLIDIFSFNSVEAFQDDESISFKIGSNNYDFFISNQRGKNKLRMSAIISGIEYEYSMSIQNELDSDFLQYEIIKGRDRHYDSLWATLDYDLKANNINNLHEVESDKVINAVIDFISQTQEIKDYCYTNRKQLSNGRGF
ncbi:hypothetical protein [Flavobacterium sp. Arc2]|uniref:hypothetical protein n=1 Tax=Flavobacterium sp. Arc2 TaxID=3046685 RepID=UPI00352F376F